MESPHKAYGYDCRLLMTVPGTRFVAVTQQNDQFVLWAEEPVERSSSLVRRPAVVLGRGDTFSGVEECLLRLFPGNDFQDSKPRQCVGFFYADVGENGVKEEEVRLVYVGPEIPAHDEFAERW